jgi:hypothetical protein
MKRNFIIRLRGGEEIGLDADQVNFTDHFVAFVSFGDGLEYRAAYYAIDTIEYILDKA